jgi:hypothetical protein
MELDRNSMSVVRMTNEEWQTTLAVLREGPYKVVAQIIEKIVTQCMNQADADRTTVQ